MSPNNMQISPFLFTARKGMTCSLSGFTDFVSHYCSSMSVRQVIAACMGFFLDHGKWMI